MLNLQIFNNELLSQSPSCFGCSSNQKKISYFCKKCKKNTDFCKNCDSIMENLLFGDKFFSCGHCKGLSMISSIETQEYEKELANLFMIKNLVTVPKFSQIPITDDSHKFHLHNNISNISNSNCTNTPNRPISNFCEEAASTSNSTVIVTDPRRLTLRKIKGIPSNTITSILPSDNLNVSSSWTNLNFFKNNSNINENNTSNNKTNNNFNNNINNRDQILNNIFNNNERRNLNLSQINQINNINGQHINDFKLFTEK